MKKYLLILGVLFLALLTPSFVSAVSVGLDRFLVGGLRTIHIGDRLLVGARATTTDATLEVQGKIASGFYVATTTTATSTFAGKISRGTPYTADGSADVMLSISGINQKGLVVQGLVGQLANAFEFQVYDGAPIFAITADPAGNSNVVKIGYGRQIGFASGGTTPDAGIYSIGGGLKVTDGASTNAGTLNVGAITSVGNFGLTGTMVASGNVTGASAAFTKIGVGVAVGAGFDLLSNTTSNILDGAGVGGTGGSGITWTGNSAGYMGIVQNTNTATNAQGILSRIAGTDTANRILTLNSNGVDRVMVDGAGNLKTTAKTFFGNVDLGGYNNFYGTGNGFVTIQTHSMNDGESHLNIIGAAVTGTAYGMRMAIDASTNLEFLAQNNGAGHATFHSLVLGAGDAISQYNINGGQAWTVGLDNSDSDKFKISASSGLGTSDAMTIDTTGQVGIGTASPGERLSIAGSLSFDSASSRMYQGGGVTGAQIWRGRLQFLGNDTANVGMQLYREIGVNALDLFQSYIDNQTTPALFIKGDGKVGIGTTTPYAKLSVTGQIVGEYFSATSTTASQFPYASTTMITATTASSTKFISGVGTAALPGYTFTGDTDTGISQFTVNTVSINTGGVMQWYVDGNGDWRSASGVSVLGDNTNAPNDPPFGFNGDNDTGMYNVGANILGFTTGATQRMVIGSTGNVGISTSTPSALLTVGASGSATTTSYFDSGTGKGTCLIMKDADGTGVTYVYANNGTLFASTASCK